MNCLSTKNPKEIATEIIKALEAQKLKYKKVFFFGNEK